MRVAKLTGENPDIFKIMEEHGTYADVF